MANSTTKIVEIANSMIANKWRYVYGYKGAKITKSQVLKLAKMYPSVFTTYIKNLALAKVGKIGIDCSGFVCRSAGISAMGSSQLIANAKNKWSISDLSHRKSGMGIWRNGHVAIISKENGKWYILEAASTATDLKKTPFENRYKAFTYYFEIPGVDYTTKAITTTKKKTASKAKVTTNGGNLNVRSKANSTATIVGKFANGVIVNIVSTSTNWYCVEGVSIKGTKIKGYVSAKYVRTVK